MKLIKTSKGKKIIGYLTYRRIGEKKHDLYELVHIMVDSENRHKGVGEELFKRMLGLINYRKLFLTTHASNKIAHKFYEKMGMKVEAVLPDHYYEGEPELVYSMKNGGN